jgi:hypothetical protein
MTDPSMKARHALYVLVFTFVIAGCYYDKEELLYPSLSSVCDTTGVTFAKSIKPMLASNCYSCHSDANAASFGNGLKFETYDEVKSQAERVYFALSHEPGYSAMPKNGAQLSSCAIRTFQIWMENNMPNTVAANGGAK